MIEIAYITSRKNSRFEEWFLPSLARQIGEDRPRIIKIDRHAKEPRNGLDVLIHPPKPSVWSGPHRLTSQDWFSAASYRSTALCLCATTHIAYVDDLTVLGPDWWQAAQEASKLDDTITCGLYQKVRNLVVANGAPVSYEQPASGIDNRMQIAREESGPCKGEWLYGCSLVAPVEALLSVDGWPEMICDGMGFEDCLMGIVLENAGCKFRFDKRLFTLESEEAHFEEPAMKRSDYGVSPLDKSHAALNIARQSKTFDNGFGPGGIRALRECILSGEPFPVKGTPEHEWFTSTPLRDL